MESDEGEKTDFQTRLGGWRTGYRGCRTRDPCANRRPGIPHPGPECGTRGPMRPLLLPCPRPRRQLADLVGLQCPAVEPKVAQASPEVVVCAESNSQRL